MPGSDERTFRATVDGLGSQDMLVGAMQQFWRQKESLLLQQLGQLVKDGLIEVVETQPVLCMEPSIRSVDRTFTMHQAVALRLRGQEVIDALKAENQELRDRLSAIAEAVNPILGKKPCGPSGS